LKDTYLEHYILSYFRQERVTSVSQILHVFQAKRTPSMFYMIEVNQWHHGFSLTNNMERTDLKKLIKKLLHKQFLVKEGKGYLLTDKGVEQVDTYFKNHYYPKQIQGFEHANVRQPFWSRFQLFTQVFSELSYQNGAYTPVIKHPHHQENVRQFFQKFPSKKEKLLDQWLLEQNLLFTELAEEQADVLASQLTGHGIIGETNAQIAAALEMTTTEFYFYKQDAIERMLQFVWKQQTKLPLISVLLKELHQETNFGLSMSTRHTYELLKEGHGIKQIARRRSIKENTVREHILEMAFVFQQFPFQHFVPQTIYNDLHQKFETNNAFDFRQAMAENEALEFMHFRLVELERIRMK
jgi:ribulose-phosphate 3-epimerase